jgi:dihydrofolate reductase
MRGDDVTDQKVFVDITMSLDGFIAGPNDGPGNGLGDGGEELHEWVYDLAAFREPHGQEGGIVNADSKLLDEAMNRPGAIICGKRMFENAEGWGDDPPFHKPVFVLTHKAREELAKAGGTTFTFVTDGIESALKQARTAAGDKDVSIAGGADTVQQFIKAGLLDEMRVHIAPLMLGGGVRLFDRLPQAKLEKARAIDSDLVTHLSYRIVK